MCYHRTSQTVPSVPGYLESPGYSLTKLCTPLPVGGARMERTIARSPRILGILLSYPHHIRVPLDTQYCRHWVLVCVGRTTQEDPRYMYPGILSILDSGSECVGGTNQDDPRYMYPGILSIPDSGSECVGGTNQDDPRYSGHYIWDV